MHIYDIEQAIVTHFCPRRNLIVPNVSWGFDLQHEVDLLVVTPSGNATEVEIKASISDIRADLRKRHGHESAKISRIYFAYPLELHEKAKGLIPAHAGIITVDNSRAISQCKVQRVAKIKSVARKITENERLKLGHLAAMRIWSLKRHIKRYQTKA
ncbi:MAG: MmcB family DNA repair protein [Deltaproteobacteria bacterium]|nr:MmcB family DNA repair protein [Deltaproteobacteria bacterium]